MSVNIKDPIESDEVLDAINTLMIKLKKIKTRKAHKLEQYCSSLSLEISRES